MASSVLPVIAALLVILLILTEIAAAVLPLIVVLVFVPREDRDGLARLIAACDSSRKLRIWTALRLAVRQRRQERHQAFDSAPAHHDQLINAPYGYGWPADRTLSRETGVHNESSQA